MQEKFLSLAMSLLLCNDILYVTARMQDVAVSMNIAPANYLIHPFMLLRCYIVRDNHTR